MSRVKQIARRVLMALSRRDPLTEAVREGLVVGNNSHFFEGVSFDPGHSWQITIGDDVTFAPGVKIIAHDASMHGALGCTRIGKVTIGSRVFVGAFSIILPGVSIGSEVVIGAGSVVSRDIPDGVVAAGNPCKVIGTTEAFLERKRTEMTNSPYFGEQFTSHKKLSRATKRQMRDQMKNRIGYMV
jgi:maltose O-acetyltransferase